MCVWFVDFADFCGVGAVIFYVLIAFLFPKLPHCGPFQSASFADGFCAPEDVFWANSQEYRRHQKVAPDFRGTQRYLLTSGFIDFKSNRFVFQHQTTTALDHAQQLLKRNIGRGNVFRTIASGNTPSQRFISGVSNRFSNTNNASGITFW